MAVRRETPAMQQYSAFKKRFPGCVVFFRMGDFYEMFDDDAVLASRVLGITLTQRTEGIPMAGVPYHSAENYLRRMVLAGHRVVTCDQVQDPKEAKGGVIERAVTRILTPGTLVDEGHLESEAPNGLAAVMFLDAGEGDEVRAAVAVVELSTGEFTLIETIAASVVDELMRRAVREMLYVETTPGQAPPRVKRILQALSIPGTARASWHFRHGEASEVLREHFGVATFAGFGVKDDDPAIGAAGAILRYLRETQAMDDAERPTSEGFSSGSAVAMSLRRKSLAHLSPPKRENPADYLIIDAVSLRALEIERTLRGESHDGSLISVFTQPGRCCRTPMGRRLLREWLCRPLANRGAIEARQRAVGTLVEDVMLARALNEALGGEGAKGGAGGGGVQDVARIAARVALARATPRDLVALGRSLIRAAELARVCEGAPSLADQHRRLVEVNAALVPLGERINAACVDEPPGHMREGGLIRDGVDAGLDEARSLQKESHGWLAEYQKKLIDEHGLPSLKVGYNQVFGYYIELPSAQSKRAPVGFSRRQTLKNAERYITPELKEFEDKVLTAGERALRREIELFGELCTAAAAKSREIAAFAQVAAELDVLGCFAAVAGHKRWTKPKMVDEPVLDVAQGRHPVLEMAMGSQFVPNDVRLGLPVEGNEGAGVAGRVEGGRVASLGPSLALITGPNMAGKSTFIRQVALIVILAHAGSFVPAEGATIGMVDRVFTRIGADDALHAGQSTFMVEMIETANILHHAGERSLVVLDEIGRGTSTLDGLSLAWAIAEKLAGGPAVEQSKGAKAKAPPRTLFATHYHELTDLADRLPSRVMNLQVAVREWGEEVVFLHRILPGRASRSYGIHVAKLAGLPAPVVKRAAALLESLSVSHTADGEVGEGGGWRDRASAGGGGTASAAGMGGQMALFKEYVPHPAVEELKEIKLETLSPMEAFDALRRLVGRATAPLVGGVEEGKKTPRGSMDGRGKGR
ncbi:MAG TPA: DNA mismatch repair protein MutS [Phycisphaerales bacterium]|nr:DNA mismatch repair protein MutS [Phycisphaerales bacterium]